MLHQAPCMYNACTRVHAVCTSETFKLLLPLLPCLRSSPVAVRETRLHESAKHGSLIEHQPNARAEPRHSVFRNEHIKADRIVAQDAYSMSNMLAKLNVRT